MATIKEGNYPGEFLKSDLGPISRDLATFAQHSETYASGTVLGEITVSRKLARFAPAAADGTQVPVAISHGEVDARAADAKGVVIARLAEVKDARLVWPDGITANQKKAAIDDLDARNIVVRS